MGRPFSDDERQDLREILHHREAILRVARKDEDILQVVQTVGDSKRVARFLFRATVIFGSIIGGMATFKNDILRLFGKG